MRNIKQFKRDNNWLDLCLISTLVTVFMTFYYFVAEQNPYWLLLNLIPLSGMLFFAWRIKKNTHNGL